MSLTSGYRPKPVLSQLELRCPPLPQTLMEALELMEHPENLEVRPVTRIVQRDPFVVARLLHIANSAYYGLRNTISSAERAVVMLGPVAVVGIVIGMNMLKLRSVFEGRVNEIINKLTEHGIATAFLARHLLEGPPRSNQPLFERIGASFTAGLLHDFGKLVLIYNFPDKAAALYDQKIIPIHLKGDEPLEREQLIFGYDHIEAGEYAARKLGFAEELTCAIQFHHHPEACGEHTGNRRLVWGVAAANVAAKMLGYHFERPLPIEEATSLPIWQQLIENRYVAHHTPEALIEDLFAQKPHLQAYLDALMVDSDDT